MIRAAYSDKNIVVSILSRSFDANKSTNYIVKQDKRRGERMRKLMAYSFDVCYRFGEVFLSDDKNACALVLFPDKKKTDLKSILLDAKLALGCIGLSNVASVMKREAMVKRIHPGTSIYYLWFIGVDPAHQHKGTGSFLLKELIQESVVKQRPVYLETSTLKNIPWYEKFGFSIYHELDLDYRLFFMKRHIGLVIA